MIKPKKKIGIMTLPGSFNYGNRLQAFALKSVIDNNLSCSATQLIQRKRFKKIGKIYLFVKRALRGNISGIKMNYSKTRKFRKFTMDYTRDAALSEDYRNLDLYIAGSDQIWHPKYHEYGDFFLSLAPPKRRFSYAASFGVSEIPGNLKDYYSKHLKSFEKISVREEDGKRIVEELTGRHDIVVVPDPTMLLAREDWDSTIIDARPIDMPKRKYLIVYALHDFTPKNQEKINKYAEKNKLEVYQIMGDMYNNKYHIPDPREFVYLIKNAECVFTDSFHCCIFSIIYHRPFIVFERADGQKMSSRLMTLTNRFQLHQAMSDGKAVFDSTLKSENFSKTDTIIQEYRKIGLEYLEGVIK